MNQEEADQDVVDEVSEEGDYSGEVTCSEKNGGSPCSRVRCTLYTIGLAYINIQWVTSFFDLNFAEPIR